MKTVKRDARGRWVGNGPKRSYYPPSDPNRAEEFRAMWIGGAKLLSISRHFRVSKVAVQKWRTAMGLKPRPTGSQVKRISKERNPTVTEETVQPGTPVRINCPENPRLHGTEAQVVQVESWGAHLLAPAAATGKYRAAWQEMEIVDTILCPPTAPTPTPVTNGHPSLDDSSHRTSIKSLGYTGNICPNCQGCRMIRTGSCVTCEDCGHNEGCG